MNTYPYQSFPGDKSRTFTGKWITNDTFSDARPIDVFHRQLDKVDLPATPQNQHILFRRSFNLAGMPSAAHIYISADDAYRLYINGKYITQGPCPGYHFHYYYNVIDVTPYIHAGLNVIAVHTYYQGLINRVWVSGDNRHGLLMDLVADGVTILASDESFITQKHSGFGDMGATGYRTQYLEKYDSRSDETCFTAPDYNDSSWHQASIRSHVDYAMYEQPTPQLSIEHISPVIIAQTGGGVRIDFGGMYVGNITLKAAGSAGDTIRIRAGQELNDDGSVRFDMRCNCRYEEEWILSGGSDTLYQFDYKAFRYVDLSYPAGVDIDCASIKLIAQHYPMNITAPCNSADPTHQAVYALCARSLKYGVQDVIQDCMEREKGQYLGDGCYSAIAHAVLSGDPRILEKLIEDTLRSAFITPSLMTCSNCSFMQEIADYPLWMPMLALMYAALTGNIAKVAAWYPGIASMLDEYRSQYERDGLLYDLDKWCVVEWPRTSRDGYDYDLMEDKVCEGTHNVICAYYVGAIKAANKLTTMLDLPPYRDPAPLQEAYIRAFYDEPSGLFRDAIQSSHTALSSNAVALYLDLCPDERSRQAVISMIRQKRLTSGMFYSSWAAMCGLWRVGEKSLALELIRDEGAWPRMIREGATTTFEGWGKDTKWNTSLFHLTFTYPLIFLTDWGLSEALAL